MTDPGSVKIIRTKADRFVTDSSLGFRRTYVAPVEPKS